MSRRTSPRGAGPKALVDRAVLAVHGHDLGPARPRDPHEQRAGDDERLLVGERETKAEPDRLEAGREPRESRRGLEHDVDAPLGDEREQSGLARCAARGRRAGATREARPRPPRRPARSGARAADGRARAASAPIDGPPAPRPGTAPGGPRGHPRPGRPRSPSRRERPRRRPISGGRVRGASGPPYRGRGACTRASRPDSARGACGAWSHRESR